MEKFKSQRFRARVEALGYRRQSQIKWKSLFAVAASLLLACGLTAMGPDGWYGVSADYSTARGGHEIVMLDDGTRLKHR